MTPAKDDPRSELRVDTSFVDAALERELHQALKDMAHASPDKESAIDSISEEAVKSVLTSHSIRITQNDRKISAAESEVRVLTQQHHDQGISIGHLQGDAELLEDVRNAQQQMTATIGMTPTTFKDKSLWESLSTVATISRAQGDFIPRSELVGFVPKAEMDKLVRVMNTLFARMVKLESGARTVPSSIGGGRDDRVIGVQLEIDRLTNQVALLEDREAHGVNAMPLMEERVKSLVQNYIELKQQVSVANVFYCNGERYGSVQDVELHLGTSLRDANIGWFSDIYGALSRLGESFYNHGEYARVLKDSRVGLLSTTLETTLMGDMASHGILYFFERSGGSKTLVDSEVGFGYRLTTMEKFTCGGAPQRTEIGRMIAKQMKAIAGAITHTGPSATVAHAMLEGIKTQVSALLSFMEQWHSELLLQCNYETKEAWPFIGQCVREILNYLTPPRVEVSEIQDWSEPSNKAQIIWAMMQVHIRMEEMMESGFKSHSTVTTTMANFIMKTRVSESSVTGLEKKVKEVSVLPGKVAALEAEIKTLKASLKKK